MAKNILNEPNQNLYDFRNKDNYAYKMEKGLSADIVKQISAQKHEPKWMLNIRLKALKIYNQLSLPVWGYCPADAETKIGYCNYIVTQL